MAGGARWQSKVVNALNPANGARSPTFVRLQ
jgi:hypothetical protein